MRGRKADIRDGFARPVERPGAAKTLTPSLQTVLDPAGFVGVGTAELDAIEAFLMPQILALLNESQRADSEAPQCRLKNNSRNIPERVHHEILAEDTV